MIKWHLRQVMAEKGIWTGQELLNALEKKAGIIISHTAAMQLIKQKPKAIRFQTLDALCEALDCNPWDLIEYKPNQQSKQDEQVAGGSSGAIRPYARKSKTDETSKNNLYPEEDF
ncbi:MULTISPECIES: helix-turn-helix domain-containing protein [Bacillus]|uniref:helix-turn-helix domain-containing protein n=1 Tax=Bacillus TaxID=1386 RepID=UPI001E32DC53|nr:MULTISPECIES: helix-turn-helix domain-containing protein [Bacillus]MCC2928991.1 helix-turn-helix domain-containing protein [Bacillus sp. LBG-1-113]MEC1406769.1 helix-turn-helix domain-containing protein [Bacillus halotolerans]